jgi:predicted RecA/RadA family phage recombinase
MALNEIYKDANSLVFPVASTVVSGQLVQVGQIVGVAENKAVLGEDGNYYATLKLEGVFELSTLVAVTVGQSVYLTSGGVVNVTSASNKFIGHAIKAKTTSVAGPVYVRLHQSPTVS